MRKAIDKELISHLLMLESSQQEKVLAYIKDLLTSEEWTAGQKLQKKQ